MHRDWSLLAELFFGLVHLSNEVDKPFARLGNSLQNPKTFDQTFYILQLIT